MTHDHTFHTTPAGVKECPCGQSSYPMKETEMPAPDLTPEQAALVKAFGLDTPEESE